MRKEGGKQKIKHYFLSDLLSKAPPAFLPVKTITYNDFAMITLM